MTFKTKEEMFGDGAGFGTQVGIDLTNPSGYSAGNRGIGFGEQLTSAIANRTHYALALNDEDLDARIGVLETDGLDAPYRLGATAVAGGGRVITLDGGAVETQSTLTTRYADDVFNAHFRANATGDTLDGSVGFDFVSDADPTFASNGTGWPGIIDRRAYGAVLAGNFSAGASVRLNPGGAGTGLVRLLAGSFFTIEAGPTPPAGNYTSLIMECDLLEITGSANDDGVYQVASLGAVATDINVVTLNNSTPTFPSDEDVTATIYRPLLASFGSHQDRPLLQGNVLSTTTGAPTALKLLMGEGTSERAGKALEVFFAGNAGATVAGGLLDHYGRLSFSVLSEDLPYDYVTSKTRTHAGGGAFATKVTRALSAGGAGEFGHLVTGDDTVEARYDFTSLVPYLPAGIANFDSSIPFTFIAASPTNGRLDLSGAGMVSGFWDSLLEFGMVVEITSGSGDTPGYYILSNRTEVSDYIEVQELDGGAPSHFPTSSSGTLRFFSASRVGTGAQASPIAGMTHNAMTTMTPGSTFVGGPAADSAAVVIMTPGNPLGTETRAALLVYKNLDPLPPYQVFAVMPGEVGDNGYIEAYQGVFSENIFLALSGSELLYGVPGTPAPRSRTMLVNLGKMISQAGATVRWEIVGGTGVSDFFLTSLVNSGYAYIPLNDMLKTGMTITDLRFRVEVNGGGAHATVGDRFTCGLAHATPTFAMTGTIAPTVIGSADDGNTTGWQTLVPIVSGAHVVDLATKDYYIYFKASVDGAGSGDDIHAIELTVDDPGPRNY